VVRRRKRRAAGTVSSFQGTPIGDLEALASKYALGLMRPGLPGESPPGHSRELGLRAARLPLMRLMLPPSMTPEEVADLKDRIDAQQTWDDVGDAAREAIHDALTDAGIAPSAPWVYMTYARIRQRGRGLFCTRVYFPIPELVLYYPHLVRGDLGHVAVGNIVVEYPWDQRFEGYRFEMFGTRLQSVATLEAAIEQQPPNTLWMMTWPGPAPSPPCTFAIVTYRARIFHRDSPVVGVAHWRPGQEVIETEYKGGTLGNDDTSIAKHGLELHYGFQRHVGGRPATPNEEAFEQAVRYGLEWIEDTPGATPANFDRKQLTAKRVTGEDATKSWLRDKHFGIREVQQEIARRLRNRGDQYP
jgi:hypothetical protein